MKSSITLVLAILATVFLSGCYVSEAYYTSGYRSSAPYGRSRYYSPSPYYYDDGPRYGRAVYPSRAPVRYYSPGSCKPKHKFKHKGHHPHGPFFF